MDKLNYKGIIKSIQPRIRLLRSFDEASHTYLGYAIRLEGDPGNSFSIGIGKAAQAKLQLKVNDMISGECLPVTNPDMEPVDYYKVSNKYLHINYSMIAIWKIKLFEAHSFNGNSFVLGRIS